MNFDLTPEQQQLAEAVRRWAEKGYGFEHRRAVMAGADGCDRADWQALVDLGLTALPVPADAGGFDGTAVDLMVVMQALGPALLLEPYAATLAAAECLRRAGGHEAVLAEVAEGRLRLATAFGEPQARHELQDVTVRAKAESGEGAPGWRLRGRKTMVLHGSQVDRLVVSARVAGDSRDTQGLALLLVDARAPGVTQRVFPTVDGLRACHIDFDLWLPDSARIGQAGAAWPLLEATADHAALLACAEGIGVMEALNTATLDYLRTRQQFGAPLGRQQVLQHRMAEMFIALEQARSLTLLAAMRLAEEAAVAQPAVAAEEGSVAADPQCSGNAVPQGSGACVPQSSVTAVHQSSVTAARRQAVAAAKVQVGEALRFVGEQAVHLHGGIGVTDELPVSHLFKRATMLAQAWGDPAHHLERFAGLPGFRPERVD
jgi:alkylation response protein AidB-like acyl-CoA dehydrogenase